MRRIAAHYLCLLSDNPLKMHYIETGGRGEVKAVLPLEQEMEAVSFFSGILFVTDAGLSYSPSFLLEEFQKLQLEYPSLSAFQVMEKSGCLLSNPQEKPVAVDVFLLDGLDLSSPKFRADDGRRYGHIQRL